MINNLFQYATSELSQDAFLCWLFSYAHVDSKVDPALRDCALAMIKHFVPNLREKDNADIMVIDILRQHKAIDVLIELKEDYVILIENKTNTSEHDNQLTRYLELAQQEYEGKEIIPIYYKTGFQGDYSRVQEAGYTVVDWSIIPGILSPYKDRITNAIFCDYLEEREDFLSAAQAYQNMPISKWDWRQVNGFYDSIYRSGFYEKYNFYGGYGYVPNPSGGFDALWFFPDSATKPYMGQSYILYMQLEFRNAEMKICMKVECGDKDPEQNITPSELRNYLTYSLDESNQWVYRLEQYGFVKPARFGAGKTMTIGEYAASYDDVDTFMDAFMKAISAFHAYCAEVAI